MNINIKNLEVSRGSFNLKINETFEEGYIYALVGNNGSGKTTLLESILGAIEINSGNIFYNELGFKNNYEEIKSKYAYVADDCLFNDYPIIKIITALSNLDKRFDIEKCLKILKKFEINENSKTSNLSKGNLKKFQFAVGISTNAEILILDEPTANVDPKSKKLMLNMLRDFMNDEKIIIFSTHIISEVSKIADYIVLLDKGHIILKEDTVSLQEKYSDDGKNLVDVETIVLKMLGEEPLC